MPGPHFRNRSGRQYWRWWEPPQNRPVDSTSVVGWCGSVPFFWVRIASESFRTLRRPSKTTVVRDAWSRRQALTIHGWIYALRDGLLQDLDMCVTGEAELQGRYEQAQAEVRRRTGCSINAI